MLPFPAAQGEGGVAQANQAAGRIGVSITVAGLSRLYGGRLERLLETARIADQLGIDQIVMPDHLAIGLHTERYPYGPFPLPREEPWLEPLTTLAAMAGVTERIRLGTGVLLAPLRPALVLAKTLATLDVLSGGRVDLGVGLGWQREEVEAAGVSWSGRASRLDDTLRACRVLWRDAPASFESDTVSFQDLWCLPRPVQPGGIPIWLGAAPTPRNVKRILELEAGWMPLGDEQQLKAGLATLRQALADAGRSPDSLRVRANVVIRPRDEIRPALDHLRELGVTTAAFALGAFARGEEEIRPFLERLARAARV
jgi:probable F420-dependent oxidoreductase